MKNKLSQSLELSGLSATFGKRLRLKIVGQGLQVEVHNDFSINDHRQYRLPDLVAGLPLEVGLRLISPAGPLSAKVQLSWDDTKGQRQRMSETFYLEAVADATLEDLPENHQVKVYLAKLEATRARRKAMEALDRGNQHDAQQLIASAATEVGQYRDLYGEEFAELEALRREIEHDQGVARKRMSTQSLRNFKGKGP